MPAAPGQALAPRPVLEAVEGRALRGGTDGGAGLGPARPGVRQRRPTAGADLFVSLSHLPAGVHTGGRGGRDGDDDATAAPAPWLGEGRGGSAGAGPSQAGLRLVRTRPRRTKGRDAGPDAQSRAGTQSGGGSVWAGARPCQSRGPWGVARR